MVMPNKKKKKEQQAFLDGLKKGHTVVTMGGMHGKLISISEHTVEVEVDRGVKIIFEKGSLSKENTEMLKSGDKKAS
jgi:preprotein translocase subunit YajC